MSGQKRPAAAPPGQPSVFGGSFAGFTRSVALKTGSGTQLVQLAPPAVYVKPVACRHARHGCNARFDNAAGEAGHEPTCRHPVELERVGPLTQALVGRAIAHRWAGVGWMGGRVVKFYPGKGKRGRTGVRHVQLRRPLRGR